MTSLLLGIGATGVALRDIGVRGQVGILVSPYVTDAASILGIGLEAGDVTVVTDVTNDSVRSGAISLDALESLIARGVSVYAYQGARVLHAKVFAVRGGQAIVGSANLTASGLYSNVEAGVCLSGQLAKAAYTWALGLVRLSLPVSASDIHRWRDTIPGAGVPPPVVSASNGRLQPEAREPSPPSELAGQIVTIIRKRLAGSQSPDVFLCNSDRKDGSHREALMLESNHACAWWNFSGHLRMESVQPGDAVLLIRDSDGVIAAGVATGTCVVVNPGDPAMIDQRAGSREWQLPVSWVPLEPPVPCRSAIRGTFQIVSAKREWLLEAVHARLNSSN